MADDPIDKAAEMSERRGELQRDLMISIDPADRQKFYMIRCVTALEEARTIRENPQLMNQIRAFLRERRDEFARLLDWLG